MELYSVLSEYIDVLAIIWGGIKLALMSFILSLLILLIFKKKVLVRRSNSFLKYLSRSYYFLVPIICLFFGGFYGVMSTTKDEVIGRLPLYQSTIQDFVNQNFNFSIEVETYTNKSLDQTIDDVVMETQRTVLAELKLDSEYQGTTEKWLLTVLESPMGMSYLKLKLKETIAARTGTDKVLVDEVFKIELSKVFTGETIIKVAAIQIKNIINNFVMPFMMLWLFLILIPMVEIIVANQYNKKYQSFLHGNSVS